jgi:hypothetical protein
LQDAVRTGQYVGIPKTQDPVSFRVQERVANSVAYAFALPAAIDLENQDRVLMKLACPLGP